MKPHSITLQSIVLGTALLTAAPPAGAGLLVSDTFADGSSTNQDIAGNSLQVFYGRSTTNTRTDAAGSVTFGITSTSSDAYWAHFTDDTDPAAADGHNPVTLANDGDMLTVRVTFALTLVATGNTDIRFGIGDSKGTRNTTDLSAGQNNAAFADDTFYGGIFGVTGSGSPFRISKRIAAPSSPNNPFNAGADALTLTTEAGGTGTRQPLASDTDYTFTYTIKRDSAAKMVMTSALSGGDIAGPYDWTAADDGLQATAPGFNNSFDWVTFRIGGSTFASAMVIKKIEAETNFSGGGSPYDIWAAGFGLNPAGNGARPEDPDFDGLPNAIENLLGLVPNVSGIPAAGVLHGALTGSNFEVRFIRSTSAVVAWKVQWSTGLAGPWTDAVNGVDGVTVATNPLPENKEEIIVSLPQNGAARLFARLSAQ